MNRYDLYNATKEKGYIHFKDKAEAKTFKKEHKELIYLTPIQYSFSCCSYCLAVVYDSRVKELGYKYEIFN